MKNLCKLIIILLITNLGFAQNTGKKGTYGLAGGTIGKKQETPKNSVSKTETNFTNSCYKNFAFSLKNYGYNKDGKFYSWGIKVKNNYNQAVQLKYKLIVGNDNSVNGTLTYYIKPGETYANDYGTAQAIIVGNNSDKYKIEVTEVCFEGRDCIKNGYAECGGKQNTISSKTKTNLTKKTTTSTLPLSQFLGYKGMVKVQEMRALLFKFIQENVVMPKNSRYPGEAFILNFEVDENGKIINPIAYGKYPEINEAAIKALKLSEGDWTIQIIEGKKVSTEMGLSLSFPVDGDH